MNPVQIMAALRAAYLSWVNREALSRLPAEAKQAFKTDVIDNMKAGYNTPIAVLNERDRRRTDDKVMRICIGLLVLAFTIFMIGAAILGS